MPTPTELNLVLVAAAGVIAAITGLIVAIVKGIEQIGEMRAENATMRKQVAEVHHEATPNSGASMHDAILLTIQPMVAQVADRVEQIGARYEADSEAAAERRVETDRRLDAIEKSGRGTKRDVGRLADAMIELGKQDRLLAEENREDRDRAQREHAALDSRITKLGG